LLFSLDITTSNKLGFGCSNIKLLDPIEYSRALYCYRERSHKPCTVMMLFNSMSSRLVTRWPSPAVVSSRCFTSLNHRGPFLTTTTTTTSAVPPHNMRQSAALLLSGITSNKQRVSESHPVAATVLSQPWFLSPQLNLQHAQHASAPVTLGWVDIPAEVMENEEDIVTTTETLELLNRNARRGKRANKGKRPCSHQRRRKKRRAYGSWRR
jgi:hypothetical protein